MSLLFLIGQGEGKEEAKQIQLAAPPSKHQSRQALGQAVLREISPDERELL